MINIWSQLWKLPTPKGMVGIGHRTCVLDDWSTPGSRFQANSTGLFGLTGAIEESFSSMNGRMDSQWLPDFHMIRSRILKTLDSWNIKAWWSWGPHKIALVVSVNCGCYRCRLWISTPNKRWVVQQTFNNLPVKRRLCIELASWSGPPWDWSW